MADLFTVVGYLALVGCYTPQWVRILRTKEARGLSPLFLGLALVGLVFIQAGLWLADAGWPLLWGNGLALVNAALVAGCFWRVSGRG